MEDLLTKWLVMGAVAMLGGWGVCCSRHTARRTARRLAMMRRQSLAVFGAFAIVCCIEAQKCGNMGEVEEFSRVEQVERVELRRDGGFAPYQDAGIPGRAACPHAAAMRGGVQGYSVTANDIARGWRVESVTTNGVFGYLGEYSNRIDNAEWHQRGGYKMRCRVDFGDWRA